MLIDEYFLQPDGSVTTPKGFKNAYKRIVDGGETNYISATLALYLDAFNVFQGLLILLGMGGERE